MDDEVPIADQAASIQRAIDRLAHDGNFPIKALRAALFTVMTFEHLPAEHGRVVAERDAAEQQLRDLAEDGSSGADFWMRAQAETAKELADLQRTFDLRWKADQRAIKMWRDAHPGNDLVWPDRCDMVVWLLDQLDDAKTTIAVLI